MAISCFFSKFAQLIRQNYEQGYKKKYVISC